MGPDDFYYLPRYMHPGTCPYPEADRTCKEEEEHKVSDSVLKQQVPESTINWWVDRQHVSTEDEVIYRKIYQSAIKGGQTVEFAKRCGTYALKRHHANIQTYTQFRF